LEKSRALLLLEELQYNRSEFILGMPDSLLMKEKRLKHRLYLLSFPVTRISKSFGYIISLCSVCSGFFCVR